MQEQKNTVAPIQLFVLNTINKTRQRDMLNKRRIEHACEPSLYTKSIDTQHQQKRQMKIAAESSQCNRIF